jgi:hypothetical protein
MQASTRVLASRQCGKEGIDHNRLHGTILKLLIVTELSRNSLFYGNQRFITIFTKARHRIISKASSSSYDIWGFLSRVAKHSATKRKSLSLKIRAIRLIETSVTLPHKTLTCSLTCHFVALFPYHPSTYVCLHSGSYCWRCLSFIHASFVCPTTSFFRN